MESVVPVKRMAARDGECQRVKDSPGSASESTRSRLGGEDAEGVPVDQCDWLPCRAAAASLPRAHHHHRQPPRQTYHKEGAGLRQWHAAV